MQDLDELSEDSRAKLIENIRKSLRYEYYVHYIDKDRRLDRWVTESNIKIDPSEIAR